MTSAPGLPALPPSRYRARWLAISLLAAALSSCGGDGAQNLSGVGTGGTGYWSVGPISGFGSIIVQGVRYDEASAPITDEEANPLERTALKLGMMVEVQGAQNADEQSGKATNVIVRPELIGPLTAVNTTAGTLTLLGFTVRTTANTVLANAESTLAQLLPGQIVEVHGLPAADGSLTATRIERVASQAANFNGLYTMRGVIAELSGTAPTWQFKLGGLTIKTDASTRVDGLLQNGRPVHVRLATTADQDGRYQATRVQIKNPNYASGLRRAELEGFVSAFTSANEAFQVNGYPAQLDARATLIGGSLASLTDGVRIEAKGLLINGVLSIQRLKFARDTADGGADGTEARFAVYDVARCVNCGLREGTLSVRGLTVTYDGDTRFANGLNGTTLDGARLAIRAIAQTRQGVPVLRATRIDPASN